MTVGLVLLAAAGQGRADIPPPEPPTIWARNQAPDKLHVIMAGLCISAAIVAGGLLLAWQLGVKSRAGKTALTIFGIVLLVAAALTVALPLRIQWENAQWKEWERRDSARWSRPREFFGGPEQREPQPPKSVETAGSAP
jgi:hypothetical protein